MSSACHFSLRTQPHSSTESSTTSPSHCNLMPPQRAFMRFAQPLSRPRRCPPPPLPISSSAALSAQMAAFAPPVARTDTTPASRSRPRPLQLDLGNNITVSIPAGSFSAVAHENVKRRSKGRRSSKQLPYAPRGPPSDAQRGVERRAAEGDAWDHAGDERARNGAVADASKSLTPAASTTSPPEGVFELPRSGADAAALLDATTMLEALSMSSSAAAFSWPAPHDGTSRADGGATPETAAAVQENVMRLRTSALPLLFVFAEQQLRAAAGPSQPPPVDPSDVHAALRCLTDHLDSMKSATRRDGRRHVSALPPPVVAALWDCVMPCLHSLALPCGRRGGDPHQPGNAADGTAGNESTAQHLTDADPVEGSDEGEVRVEEAVKKDDRSNSEEALSLAGTASAAHRSLLKATYPAARRALALHTRNIASLLPPDVVAMVLTRVYQCGALSDDVLGPVITDLMEKEQKGARNQTASPTSVGGAIMILQRRVLRLDAMPNTDATARSAPSTFQGASAITMARLLGKASLPGHHQLHQYFHFALLPEVTRVLRTTATAASTAVAATRRGEVSGSQSSIDADVGTVHNDDDDAAVAQPGAAALLDLTSAFRHYAVSGEAVQHLTTLWRLHFKHKKEVRWSDCAAVLRALSTLPIASTRSQRRQARQLPRSSGGRQDKLLLRVAEEDYFPLMEGVCTWIRQLSEVTVASFGSAPHDPDASTPATAAVASSVTGTTTAAEVSPAQLLGLLRMLLRVQSPRWAETYEALATAIVVQLAAQQPSTATGTAADVPSRLKISFSLADTQRTLKALLHRNSLIPDHPLHRVLLRRVLYAPEALTDASVAATALLGLEVMIPVDESSVGVPSPDTLSATQTTDVVQTLPSGDLTVTQQDRARALQLLRRHGRSMNSTAFIAGLCVAPIGQLPLPTQSALVNHLSSVATAVSPAYLVKGMAAVMRQLSPTAVDEVSVQRWYSRFTAVDVVRQVDSTGCAVLLDMLSANPLYERNCALAKQAITRQIGVALLRSGDEEGAAAAAGGGAWHSNGMSAASLTLEQLAPVVSALRRGNVFFSLYFSRVCRMLLSQVDAAPLGDLLIPFSVTAEEFMSRQHREGPASLFKDVWELLRGRVLDQVATLSVEETCTALNAFAALDVRDHALFSVLVYHLWTGVQRASSAVAAPGCTNNNNAATGCNEEGVQEVTVMGQTNRADPSSGLDDEAQEAMVRRVAQLGERVTRVLSPSAVAVVVTTLCAREDATSHGSGGDAMVRTMLPWMLLALRRCHTELYPIDVVHVLPPLLQRFSAAAMADAHELDLLHAAVDACRSTFLSMYAIIPDLAVLNATSATTSIEATAAATATAIRNSSEGSTLTQKETRRIAEQRAEWTPAVKMSVQVVPRSWFVRILLALSSADLVDLDVGLACVERACTRRVCGAMLPIDQLVDLCLTTCWLLRASDVAMDRPRHDEQTTRLEAEHNGEAAAVGATRRDAASTAPASPTATAPAAIFRTAMATVLSSLWYRSDELGTAQIDALLRCLRATYGADRVDVDFVQRLEAQKVRIQKRRRPAAGGAVDSFTTARDNAAHATTVPAPAKDKESTAMTDEAITTAPPPEAEQMHAEDLFSMM